MQRPRRESVLTTVLFTDIVGSSELAAELGDRRWKVLLSRHHALVRGELRRFGGRELDTAGDGFFASFDNPGNAIRCAASIVEAVQELGIEVRTGLHLGQAEILGRKLGGVAVHIGARTMARAGPAEVLVTGGLKDVLSPADFTFEDQGSHVLKGVPGEWRLFRVAAVDRPLPRPLEPEVAAARRAAVQAPPLWRRRYVPAIAAAALVVAGAVTAAVVFAREGPAKPAPAGLPPHALLKLDPRTGRVEAVLAIGQPHPPPPFGPGAGPAGGRAPGPGPRSIFAGEGSIWVTNGGGDSVARVDPVTLRLQTIHVGGRPDRVTVGHGDVWVISSRGNLTRLDPGTNQPISIDISTSAPLPMGVAVDDRGVLYVTAMSCYTCQFLTAPLSKVNPSTGSVSAVPVPPYNRTSSVMVSDGFLWVTANAEVWKVDPATGKILRRAAFEELLGDLVADPSGSSVWVSMVTSGNRIGRVVQIDGETGRIIGGQPVGCCPGAIAIGEGYVWVTNSTAGTIERISLVTGDVAPPIDVGPGVNGIAVGLGGVWVTIDR